MTDAQPGTNTQGANDAGQGAEFNVTFDEGNGTAPTDNTSSNLDNTQRTNTDNGTDNSNTGTTDAFAWVPEDYRESYKSDENLSRYKTQDDFVKAMLEDRKANGDAIKLPGADATEEEWNKVYDKLGRPTSPEGYELSKELPEGLEFNENMYTNFTNKIHNMGLSKKQAQGLYEWYNNECLEVKKHINEHIEASYRKSMDDAVAGLKKEWGTDYQENLSQAVAMANKFLSPETKRHLNATKLGNNPALIKDFYKLSQQVSGAQMKGDGPTGSYASLAELEAKMEANLRAADYTTNKTLQAENKQIADKIAEMQRKG